MSRSVPLYLSLLLALVVGGCASHGDAASVSGGKADEFETRSPNAACDPRLDEWMFGCIRSGVSEFGETLEEAIANCESASVDREALAQAEVCLPDDDDCLFDLSANAEQCASAIGAELSIRQPNPACDPRLDQWMLECVGTGVRDFGETPEEAVATCGSAAVDREALAQDEVCPSSDDDCLFDLAANAEECAAAIGGELANE